MQIRAWKLEAFFFFMTTVKKNYFNQKEYKNQSYHKAWNLTQESHLKQKKITIVKLTHAKACSFQRGSLRDCTQYKIWGIC